MEQPGIARTAESEHEDTDGKGRTLPPSDGTDKEMYKAMFKGRLDVVNDENRSKISCKMSKAEDTMCALFASSLFGSGEKWRELQLGGGCAGDDARLRGNDDVLRPSSLLCHRRDLCDCVRIPDLRKDEHGRGRYYQVRRNACGRVPVPDRCLPCLSCLFRLSHIETGCRNEVPP